MILEVRPQPPPGYTGAPREGTCRNCHESGGGGPAVHLSILPSGDTLRTYTAGGSPLRIRLEARYVGAAYYGFALTVLDDSGGAWPSYALEGEHDVALQEGPFGRRYLGHWGWSEKGVWEFDWQPPERPSGPLHWYIGVVAANGDQTVTGDRVAMVRRRVEPTSLTEGPQPSFLLHGGYLWLGGATVRASLYDLAGRILATYTGPGSHLVAPTGPALLLLELSSGKREVYKIFLP
ncbi:MAG: hypothetical protein KatS3mg026_0644 [Bacteroidia bacterium]|nr:MAG: hypothetical protein KatS3mg026_0644 [Bacteroidia bacterium]